MIFLISLNVSQTLNLIRNYLNKKIIYILVLYLHNIVNGYKIDEDMTRKIRN